MTHSKEIIEAQVAANVAGLKWGQHYLQKDNLQDMKEALVRNRVELKHITYALGMNPAAAVFGQSQVGKSYLVDNILASAKGPLKIFDGHGNSYDFIDQINPLGNGKESTSLVSRFSTQKMWTNDDYPVKASLLSPADIILTLCDTFFNDIKKQEHKTQKELHDFIEDILKRYEGKPSVQKYISEVELYEMRQYFFELDVLNQGEIFQNYLQEEKYFEKIASVIEAISPTQWVDVFGILWSNEETITKVFCKLIDTYKALDFKQEVFFQIESLLRKDGTLLHVDRLFELFGVSSYTENGKDINVEVAPISDMRVWNGTREVTLQKSEMCALTAEVVLKVDDDLAAEKPFLKQLDILDFPGARSRELRELPLDQPTACQLLIRGKVAFLFNKYSQQYLISNLMFCHHRDQSDVKTLSGLLKGWVESMIGKTVDERTRYMQLAQVSPLFLICTKFNIDLEKDDKDVSENAETRAANKISRWNTRFTNLDNLIGSNTEWFTQWQTKGGSIVPFKNTYLLRSYNFSCIKHVYKGYKTENKDGTMSLRKDEKGNVLGENGLEENFRRFIPEIHDTFMDNSFVQAHFEDPELAWFEATGVGTEQIVRDQATGTVIARSLDEAPDSKFYGPGVSPFHDGSDYIIRNLTISCRNVREMRDRKFEEKIRETMIRLCQTLGAHFHDDDSDSALREALDDAGGVTIFLDALFGADKYFFSEFIDNILIRESDLYDRILDTIKSSTLIEDTDIGVLFAIRNRAGVNPELSEEENRFRLRKTYEVDTDKALDDKLIEIGKSAMKRNDDNPLTVDDIINPPLVRNFARIIADDVENYWLEQYLQLNRFDEFVKRGMSREFIEKLLKKMNVLFRDKLHVADVMTERIHKYVVDPTNFDSIAEMVADICAEMINRFVNSMGTAYFHEGHWKSIQDTVRHNKFDITVEPTEYEKVVFDAEDTRKELNVVFDVFDNVDSILNANPVDEDKLSYFSNYHAYREWTDMMKIAFLACCDIPTYDVNANNELRIVLLTHIINSTILRGLMTDEDYENYHMRSLIQTEKPS